MTVVAGSRLDGEAGELDRQSAAFVADVDDGVGEAASVGEAIQQCRALQPNVLLLSMSVSGQDDAPAIPKIRAELPALRILALADRSAQACVVLNPPYRRKGVPLPPCATGTDCLRLAACSARRM